MSRQVYQLNDSGDEDYLSFGSPSDNVAASAKYSIRNEPPPVKMRKAPTIVRPVLDRPSMDDINDEDGDDIKPVKGKKIPIKSVQEHQLLINQLNSFGASARFAPVLKDCGITLKDLRLKSVAELKELRERVRACCANSGGSGGIVSAGILGACGQIEAFAPKRLLDLEGYQQAVEGNAEFAALCEMIEIDCNFKSTMSPMQRMALCLATTAVQVGGINKAKTSAAGASAALLDSLRAQQAQQQSQSNSQSSVSQAPIATSNLATSNESQTQKPVSNIRSY